jgi:dipeptidyl aminopeptidase/acylaminoacyl peptidase
MDATVGSVHDDDLTNLTQPFGGTHYEPTWSPDGTQIAFTSTRDGTGEIYTMDSDDGGNQTRLTDTVAVNRQPSWSPDGLTIAFSSYRDSSNEIYTISRPPKITTTWGRLGSGTLSLDSNGKKVFPLGVTYDTAASAYQAEDRAPLKYTPQYVRVVVDSGSGVMHVEATRSMR